MKTCKGWRVVVLQTPRLSNKCAKMDIVFSRQNITHTVWLKRGGGGGAASSNMLLSRVWLAPRVSLKYCIDFDLFDLKLTRYALCILVNNEV